jgi:hypothetical protein
LIAKTKKGKRFPSRKKFSIQKEKDSGGYKGREFDISSVRCFNCQKKGHFARNCPKSRKGHKGKFHVDVATKGEITYRRKPREVSIDQETRKEYYLVSVATGNMTKSAESWLVDSGASRHMTGNKDNLANFKNVKFSSQVELGPVSNKRAKVILELIHSDVCGPMSTPSLNGHVYYVIFIDDFSRKSWIYFMTTKNENFKKFHEFKALIENQTRKHIRILRSDNGGVYESHQIEDFCKEAGIKRQLALPYNPQQNGVAERKNETICEAANEMMLIRIFLLSLGKSCKYYCLHPE